jgi:hypothetical protein
MKESCWFLIRHFGLGSVRLYRWAAGEKYEQTDTVASG